MFARAQVDSAAVAACTVTTIQSLPRRDCLPVGFLKPNCCRTAVNWAAAAIDIGAAPARLYAEMREASVVKNSGASVGGRVGVGP